MPTFSTVALETLLVKPGGRDSYKIPLNSRQREVPKSSPVVVDHGERNGDMEEAKEKAAPTTNHIFISPALYITPVLAPIPDSSSDPVSPSPYVVNHKRRGGASLGRRIGGFVEDGESNSNSSLNGLGDDVVEEVVDDNFFGPEVDGGDRNGGSVAEEDDFLDPRCDSVSVASSTEVDDSSKQVECRSYSSNKGEFFDANDDFSSDGSISNLSSSYGARIESDLHGTRLSLLEEIEKRKMAEHAVAQMYSQWQRLGNLLCKTGLSFPTPPTTTNMQIETDALDQLCQELIVVRYVTEAIGRAEARAEAEIAAGVIMESKDQEISRLRDKVQYHEAVNREMSQRNQEVMEVARRRRRKDNKWWWLGSFVGLSVAVGASVIAHSYLPPTRMEQMLPSSSNSSDASSITIPESH